MSRGLDRFDRASLDCRLWHSTLPNIRPAAVRFARSVRLLLTTTFQAKLAPGRGRSGRVLG